MDPCQNLDRVDGVIARPIGAEAEQFTTRESCQALSGPGYGDGRTAAQDGESTLHHYGGKPTIVVWLAHTAPPHRAFNPLAE